MKLITKALCCCFGHQYELKENICPGIRIVTCTRCGYDFGMHDGLRALVPMDTELIADMRLMREMEEFDNQDL